MIFLSRIIAAAFTAIIGCLSVECVPIAMLLLHVTTNYVINMSKERICGTCWAINALYYTFDDKFQFAYGKYLLYYHQSKFLHINQATSKKTNLLDSSSVVLLEPFLPDDRLLNGKSVLQPIDLTFYTFSRRLVYWFCLSSRKSYHTFNLVIFSLWWRTTLSLDICIMLALVLYVLSVAFIPKRTILQSMQKNDTSHMSHAKID